MEHRRTRAGMPTPESEPPQPDREINVLLTPTDEPGVIAVDPPEVVARHAEKEPVGAVARLKLGHPRPAGLAAIPRGQRPHPGHLCARAGQEPAEESPAMDLKSTLYGATREVRELEPSTSLVTGRDGGAR